MVKVLQNHCSYSKSSQPWASSIEGIAFSLWVYDAWIAEKTTDQMVHK